ncbi:MAG TPA: UDP-glucose 4-epimerase GalE [Candidatus Saccharibacteria bacterium]|nr:UDP-glucose 4-epimerase GalE [Candidatus Saccharibacteria bacterium]HMR38141.1 UDP-glucose 4-epimerase GalE [Candidatus Saccharibacteria bacterium]
MKVLLTGGAGYIGSHTAIELISNGHSVVIVDNLSNSSIESIKRVEYITEQTIPFYKADIRDKAKLTEIFETEQPDSVIHFAGLKAVGESVAKPLEYYNNNIGSSLILLEVMREMSVPAIVFSSSATVYGTPEQLPLTENSPVGIGITNPYGQTKYMIEQILKDASLANTDLEITVLRYFNPVGAHSSGLIGEDPHGIPNNLLPFVSQVAVGRLPEVGVFGDDYNTPDGTGIRDYIHVVDLARGHVKALEHSHAGFSVYNLGTGQGVSVLELIKAFSEASGKEISYSIKPRRPGDIAACYADSSKAEQELDWKAEYSIGQACEDSWRWQSQNPHGFTE